MARQHTTPVLINTNGDMISATLNARSAAPSFDEDFVQELIHRFPACLPIAEIDPMFVGAVPICRELSTPAGPIDNLLVTPRGLPVIVECKLWKNPQARREVVGQILDYSKELTKWSCSDLQREVNRRLGSSSNALLDIVRAAGHQVNEVEFNDALTHNLRRGRFLLLIVGDGIREGVEAIADYLQAHAGLHFTLGLVELPVYDLPDGSKVVAPRILARSKTFVRTVIEVPDGFEVAADDEDEIDDLSPTETSERKAKSMARRAARLDFWSQYLDGLRLDDPEQMLPKPTLKGNVSFKLGASDGSVWLSVYRSKNKGHVGLFLSSTIGTVGENASKLLAEDVDLLRQELPGATIDFSGMKPSIEQIRTVRNFEDPEEVNQAISWLQEKTNNFINALRPRIRSALQEVDATGR